MGMVTNMEIDLSKDNTAYELNKESIVYIFFKNGERTILTRKKRLDVYCGLLIISTHIFKLEDIEKLLAFDVVREIKL